MQRLVPARLALALCCAISLVGCSSSTSTDTSQDPTAIGAALASAGNLAVSAAAAVGMQFGPLPPEGCSTSLLEPEKVVELMQQLPEAQQAALATVLSASVGVWTVQLYQGAQGVGMCLPAQQMLVLLPAGANAVVNQTAAAIAPLQSSLSGTSP